MHLHPSVMRDIQEETLMWLSDVSMQHKVFAGRLNWADCNAVHTRVMRLFGELDGTSDVRQRAGILYRVEPGIGSGRVLVQSNDSISDPDIRRVDLGSVLGGLKASQAVGVRVKANVVRTVNRTVDGITKTHREPLGIDEIGAWVAAAMGGALSDVRLDEIELGQERQRSASIATSMIDARASVVDPAALVALVGSGIGRAKAFGCGLISVRALPEESLL